MRKRIGMLAAGAAAGMAGASWAQAPVTLTPDQKGFIVYDQCMMHAAIGASHTDARDEDIFGLAKAQCGATRSAVIKGQEANTTYLAALDVADADKQMRFPAWIKGVRERRKAFDAKIAAPTAGH